MPQPTPTLRDLFETALALAPTERVAYLDAHCRDPAQREAVLHLLAADTEEEATPLRNCRSQRMVRASDRSPCSTRRHDLP
jgi:hypothetical protein